MKKVVLVALSALAVAAVAFADDDTQSAKSVNAVGVVKYTIPANGGMACISLPLDPLSNTNWVWGETEIAKQLDAGSYVYFWTGTRWASYQKNKLKGWNDEAKNYVIAPGEAFFVQSATGTTSNKTVSLLGELPVDDNLPYSIVGDGVNLEPWGATPYPVESTFGSSALASALPANSYVYFWTGTRWASYQKNKLKGWNDEAKNMPTFVGEGIFIQSAADVDVEFVRPFDWAE